MFLGPSFYEPDEDDSLDFKERLRKIGTDFLYICIGAGWGDDSLDLKKRFRKMGTILHFPVQFLVQFFISPNCTNRIVPELYGKWRIVRKMKNCTSPELVQFWTRPGNTPTQENTHTHTHTHTHTIYIYIYRARPGKTHVPDFLGGGSEQ